MKILVDIDENLYKRIISPEHLICFTDPMRCEHIIKNGTPIPDNATNGQVLFQMFPPSVYYGDDEKHIVLLTKDCELTCYNNDWWDAPYERSADEISD